MYEPNVWDTCNTNRQPYNKLKIRQYIIHKVSEAFTRFPEKATQIEAEISSYNDKLSKLGIADCVLVQKPPVFLPLLTDTVISILLLPLHIYGTILNYLPYKIPVWQASKLKDPNFRTSVQFGMSVILLPVYYLIIITLFCLYTDELLIKLAFGLTLPVSGLFAFYNFKHMNKLGNKLLVFRLKITNNKEYNYLLKNRNQVIDLIKTTING